MLTKHFQVYKINSATATGRFASLKPGYYLCRFQRPYSSSLWAFFYSRMARRLDFGYSPLYIRNILWYSINCFNPVIRTVKKYMQKFQLSRALAPVVILVFAVAVFAQSTKTALTTADYERAEKFMAYNTNQLVDRAGVRPNWVSGDRFWYRVLTPQGSEFIMVDPATGSRAPAFDHTKLAAAISTATGKTYTGNKLPFISFSMTAEGSSISFTTATATWSCEIRAYTCTANPPPAPAPARKGPPEVVSPDKKKGVFIRDFNLWVRDIASGKETQLTTDGVKDFGYGTDNAGWRHSDRPVLLWSPDSKKIVTFQLDERHVKDMYLVSTNVGAPRLQQWKYPLPGDKQVQMIHRVIIDVDAARIVRLQVPPDPHRSTLCDDIICDGKFTDNEWNADGTKLAFVSSSRDHKQAKMRLADAATGAVREVFEEVSPTQYESGQGGVNWRYLPESNEVLWYSERDNWGQLYLYDLTTGQVKNQITTGDGAVTEIQSVDEKARVIYFLAGGREKGRNPYYSHLYKVGFDGKGLTLLTPDDGNHEITWSPSERYFVDSYSKMDVPHTSVLRDTNGKALVNLEKTDISRLKESGWKAPIPLALKARDGETDIYGVMYVPTSLDPNKKYPIINNIYPGPQGGSVGYWGFTSASGDSQALAELGFVVVKIEGTCNPLRSKKFHDACYGNMADNTLPDQIAAMKQLAQKYPYIDLDRVGIWGHSGGGYATAAAMFRYPDFFKVGISESGNHENRNYEDDWGERYIGLDTMKDGKSNYEDQANQNFAKDLKGHLLLAHGLMDDNVPPYNTMLVVDALVKANKDFDLVVFPQARHGYGDASQYMTRRRWDYFVRYLQGVEPPKEYVLKSKPDPRNALQ
jgi:dipeptidyl-peptidase 4